MRKHVVLLSAVSLSLLLTACQENGKQETVKAEKFEQKQVVGVVDTARVYADSKAGIEGGNYLESVQLGMQDELIALQESMQENPTEASIALFQEKYAAFQERINLEQEQVVTKLNAALQEAMDSYRQERGLEVLIPAEAVMSMSASADVTQDIIAVLDKMPVEYVPVVLPEPVLKETVIEELIPEAPAEEVAPAEVSPETAPETTPETPETTPETAPETPESPEATPAS